MKNLLDENHFYIMVLLSPIVNLNLQEISASKEIHRGPVYRPERNKTMSKILGESPK